MIKEMNEAEHMHILSEQIAAVTQITMKEAAESIHETITACNKVDIKPFIQTKNLY